MKPVSSLIYKLETQLSATITVRGASSVSQDLFYAVLICTAQSFNKAHQRIRLRN